MAPILASILASILAAILASMISRHAVAADATFTGLGPPCSDRAFWTAPAIRAALAGVLHKADALVAAGVPAWDADAYREYESTGSRVRSDGMSIARMTAVSPLTLAACVTLEPAYARALDALFRSFVVQPSWVLSADDPGLKVMEGSAIVVDLQATELGGELGEALVLLGPMIDPALAAEVRHELRRRVVDPVLEGERAGAGPFWLRATHNWNVNCLNGFLAAALASALSPDDRARALAIAGTDIRYYLSGFDEEGYSPEGMSYWNYGFSRFALLRETLLEATGADLLADAHARVIAAFPLRFAMFRGVVAAFGDALLGQPPDRWTLAYVARAEAVGGDRPGLPLRTDGLRFAVVSLKALSPPAPPAVDPPLPASTYFAHAHMLVSRPAPGGGAIAVTMKGGSGGPHSHDDVGSYALVLCDRPVMGDPGGGRYYTRDANPKRDNPIANSYGHPVPLVGGLRQDLTAAPAAGVTVSQRAQADTMRLDLTPVYPSAAATIERTMTYARGPDASFTVADVVSMAGGGIVDSPVVTVQPVAVTDRTIVLGPGRDMGMVTVDASIPVDIVPETIETNGLTFTRIAIRSKSPTASASIGYVYRPPAGATCAR